MSRHKELYKLWLDDLSEVTFEEYLVTRIVALEAEIGETSLATMQENADARQAQRDRLNRNQEKITALEEETEKLRKARMGDS